MVKPVLAIPLIVNIPIYPPGHVKSYPQLHENMWLIAVLKKVSFKIIVISLILMGIVGIGGILLWYQKEDPQFKHLFSSLIEF